MSCPSIEELELYATARLEGDALARLDGHIAACRDCPARIADIRRGLELAGLLAGDHPPLGTETIPHASADDETIMSARRQVEEARAANTAVVAATSMEQARAEWAIPDYHRVQVCGKGAYGTVWVVRDRVGVYRALKVIDMAKLAAHDVHCRELAALEKYCQRVQHHRNLIDVFHVSIKDNILYYTMELADDARTRKPAHAQLPADYHPLTLQGVMARGPVRPDTAIEVVLRLLRGLAYLHSVGLIHRDIKPSNIIFVAGRPKIADIGVVTANTALPSEIGTPAYMPPDRRMDATADVYAMGRILYELMAGPAAPGFPRLSAAVMARADRWEIGRVQGVLDVACEDKAERRYPNATRMLEELEACREVPYDALFTGLSEPRPPPAHPYRPYILAAMRAIPWVLGLILALMLLNKLV